MSKDIWLFLISSTLVSGVVGAFIGGVFSLRIKDNEFINDYYKAVIQRRLGAYEIVEHLIRGYKTTIYDINGSPYYIVFDEDDNWQNAYEPMVTAMSNSIWLGDDILEVMKDLNSLLFHLPLMTKGITKFGVDNYIQIAKIRDELEKQLAEDMLNLHEVRKFLKLKRNKKHGFHEVNLANVILGRKNPNKAYV